MYFLLKERSLPLQKQVAFTSFDLRSNGNIEPKIIIVQLLHETGEGHSVKAKPGLYLIKTNKQKNVTPTLHLPFVFPKENNSSRCLGGRANFGVFFKSDGVTCQRYENMV